MADEPPAWEPSNDIDLGAGSADEPLDGTLDTAGTAGASAAIGPEPDGLMARIRWGLVAFISLSVVVIVLAAQNTQSVTVRALGWEAEAPLVVILLITVLVTVILDELVGVIIRRRRRARRAERAELRRLRGERKR